MFPFLTRRNVCCTQSTRDNFERKNYRANHREPPSHLFLVEVEPVNKVRVFITHRTCNLRIPNANVRRLQREPNDNLSRVTISNLPLVDDTITLITTIRRTVHSPKISNNFTLLRNRLINCSRLF